jgi:hypothetical protein
VSLITKIKLRLSEQGSTAKQITELEEWGSPHPKKLYTPTIITMVNEHKVGSPFLISGTQRTIGNPLP